MDVNEDAVCQDERGALTLFASKLRSYKKHLYRRRPDEGACGQLFQELP